MGCGAGCQGPRRGVSCPEVLLWPWGLGWLERGLDVSVGLGAVDIFPVKAGTKDTGNNL